MKITESQARRWGVYGDAPPFGVTGHDDRGRPTGHPLNTNPGVEQMAAVVKQLNEEKWLATQNLKDAVAKFMDSEFVSVTRLARELGVSRQTLYQWKQEIDERYASGGEAAVTSHFHGLGKVMDAFFGGRDGGGSEQQ